MFSMFIGEHMRGLRLRMRISLRQVESKHALRHIAQVEPAPGAAGVAGRSGTTLDER